MMTATYKQIYQRLKLDLGKAPKTYEARTDYSYVKEVVLYKTRDINMLITDILENSDDKILCFFNSLSRMKSFYEKTEKKWMVSGCIDFYCSENQEYNDDEELRVFYERYVDQNAIKLIDREGEEYYTFSKRGLISTKTLDNGVDFKDSKIKHVICEVHDIESAIQCLGRRRMIAENDYCIFHIRDYQPHEWNLFIWNTEEILKEPKMFLTDRETWRREYLSERGRTLNPCFYFDQDEEFQINWLKYQKLQAELELMKQYNTGETSYAKELLNELTNNGQYPIPICSLEAFHEKMVRERLVGFLQSHKGSILTNEEKEELIRLCNLRSKWNVLLRGEKSIGSYLSDHFEYRIDKCRLQNGTYGWRIESKFTNKAKPRRESTRRSMQKKRR